MGKLLKRPKIGGAVYLLPNLLTTGNLFFGFFAMVKAFSGSMFWAACCIFIAAIFDVLDGRVARLTGSTSEFGVQYDSLCDLLSFGVAPAVLAYHYGLSDLGRIGWVLCFFYIACGALRLARFNVQSVIGKGGGDFVGLPIPMAAGCIAAFIALREDTLMGTGDHLPLIFESLHSWLVAGELAQGFLSIGLPFLALAMVSNFGYQSHKVIKINLVHPFKLLVVLVLALGIVAYEPLISIFVLCTGYAISGPIGWVFGWKQTMDDGDIFAMHYEDEGVMEPLLDSQKPKAKTESPENSVH